MPKRTLVIAPHPDDETLGCGGTLLRRKANHEEIAWLIVTAISEQSGWPMERVHQREAEIAKVAELIGFNRVFNLQLPPAQLDRVPMAELAKKFSEVFNAFQPEEVFLPHRADVHSDHRIVFDVAATSAKWFRHPSVRRVLTYETISETEFGLAPESKFQPNCFIDISNYLDHKLKILAVYESELGAFPFPRSPEAIRAQAILRGAASGYNAAEAFQLLLERQ